MYGELKRAIHVDFHTLPYIYDFNQKFDAAAFAERLEKAHVKYVNAFAECNQGFCYYDTKIGTKYPYMKQDMFGDLLRECHKRNIGVTAYLNSGVDHEACRTHREWMRQKKDGTVHWGDKSDGLFRRPCYHSGYGEYKLSLVKEILEKYPEVDGFFMDSVCFIPCYGNECLEAIKAEGGDPTNDKDVEDFAIRSALGFLKKVKKLIGNRNLVCNSSRPYTWFEDINSHIEVECLPGALGWDYDYFAANVAYARKIKEKVVYMSGRFQTEWGDFGGLKSFASMENDALDAQMNAVACSIGDHMHPAENLDENVYDNVEKIYSKIISYEPWTNTAKYKAEIGVLCGMNDGLFKGGTYQGVARMLGELKMGFDILNETMDLSQYKLLILPEGLKLTEAFRAKVAAHLAAGKPVLSAGNGGFSDAEETFALPQWSFTYDGADTSSQAFYTVEGDSFRYGVYVPGIKMFAGPGAQSLAQYHKAYFNKEYDGFYYGFYMPPEKATGHSMAAVNGKVAHIAFNVFDAYHQYAYKAHKNLVKKCLDAIGFVPTVETDLPSTARVTLTESAENVLVHAKTTFAEMRGKALCIEDHVKYPAGATVKVRGQFTDAVILPGGQKANASFDADGVTLSLPQIDGYVCVALKKA